MRTMPTHAATMRRHRQAGATLAEFAVAAGVSFTLLLGIVGFSQAMSDYEFLASAARQATRYAIVRGSECSGWTSACPASAADIQTYVRGLAAGDITPSGLTVATTWTPDNNPGSTVKVTVSYTYNLDIPFVPAQSLRLQSSSQMTISQ